MAENAMSRGGMKYRVTDSRKRKNINISITTIRYEKYL